MSRQFVATTLLKQQGGFSLVELVTVMVLVGILTATIAPKFSSRQGFSDYAARDQIVVAARSPPSAVHVGGVVSESGFVLTSLSPFLNSGLLVG